MIAALCYLQYHSMRNQLIARVRRLKQPKYLVGAIAGGLYLYFYFFRYVFHGFSSGQALPSNLTFSAEHTLVLESVGALVLLVIMLSAWVIPHERAALTFTEAEVAFLFPAPVTRRTLIHFKLLRSQLRILFSTLILTLLSRRFGGNAWTHVIGWWLILSTLNLHFLGASFARTLLLDRGISNWLRRVLVLALAGAAVAVVWIWVKRTIPPPTAADTVDFEALLNYAGQILNAGPALYLLYPFRLLVRPFFAPELSVFLVALVPALLLFLLHYFWVVLSDVAFEEASVTASEKLAARIAAVRSGNWQAIGKKPKVRRAWFVLKPVGSPSVALLWKNLIGLGQSFSPRLIIVVMIVCLFAILSLRHTAHARNIIMLAEFMIVFALGYSLLLGPQLLRLDFRRDLPMADIVKTYPLRNWQVALGEMLAPITVLTLFQWLLLLVGVGMTPFLPGHKMFLWLAIAAGVAVTAPVLNCLLLFIPNAAVLLFPSWIQTGRESPRGIEATGQRLIFAIGQLLAMMLALLPAAVAFLAVYFPMKWALGPVVPILFAALAVLVVLTVEAALAIMLLGKLFERYDVTEETSR